MKIKQLEKGLAEPVNELLPKLLKNDSNTENSDAFEIILSLFTNTLSKLELENYQSPVANDKKEFLDNSQVNLFFKQLIKNINSQIPNEINNISGDLKVKLQDFTNPKLLIDQLVNLKNLSNQNTALNSKIANILLNSLPNKLIRFLKDDKIELTSNTQNELVQIAKIFEKIKNSKLNDLHSEAPNVKVVELKDTGKHVVENIENSTQLTHYDNSNKTITNRITALSAQQLSNEQATLKVISVTQPNNQEKQVQTLDKALSEIRSTNNQDNNSENLNNNTFHQKNSQSDNKITEDKIIEQEIKAKINTDFLPTKLNNVTQKASNYSMFNSVRPDEIPNYIVRMSNSIKNGGNYRAIMNLKPENLGSIFVNLTIKDDVLNIIIKADMNQTLEKIDSSVAQLKEALVGSGFKSDNINLRIESNHTNGQNYANSEKGFDNPNKHNQKQELRDMVQKIRQYEHILSLVKQQEVVE